MSLSWKGPIEDLSGVIVGCDSAQEWMLPWWWEKYSEYNKFPVTFIDFGLGEEAKLFCEQRGRCVELSLPASFSQHKKQVPSSLREDWQAMFEWKDDPFWWNKRMLCHKKPFAFLMSTYQHTLWMDIDCEVCGDLSPLFDKIASNNAIHIAPYTHEAQKQYEEKGMALEGEKGYNSGVVGFHWGSEQILEWAKKTIEEHPFFLSDEELFARIAFLEKWQIAALDDYYNWPPHFRGFHSSAKINHWLGNSGKFLLALRMQKII